MLVAVGLAAQQLPVPRTEAVYPGITTVTYAGNSFTFNTTVRLTVKFDWVVPNIIQIKVKASNPSMEGAMAPMQTLRIYWEEGDEVVYDDVPPTSEWTGQVLTEGGLTEK